MGARGLLIAVLLVSLAPGALAAKKAGKSVSSSEGPDLDAAARRELPCPKGYIAQKGDGPHLVVADKPHQMKAARGRKKTKAAEDDAKGGTKTHTLSRRCVPDPSLAKPAADDGAKARRTAAEALRD